MGFVTMGTRRVMVPHEEGQYIEFRPLTLSQLEEAESERTRKIMANVRAMGGEIFQALQGQQSGNVADPWDAYDKPTLLRCAIAGWSYPVVVTLANIDNLDVETAHWALDVIREMNAPKTDDARKNGSSNTIVPSLD